MYVGGGSVTPTTRSREPRFEDFFRDSYPLVVRTAALVVRDSDLGRDLAQEAFLRVYERWATFSGEDHAKRFAFKVAINLGRSHLRRRRMLPLLDSRANLDGDSQATDLDLGMILRNALVGLSPRQRCSVALVDYVGYDIESAAQILGIRESTVRVHLARGRRILRSRLQPVLKEDAS
jgi:RNA polymerase sigma factor (sigma-70 family)